MPAGVPEVMAERRLEAKDGGSVADAVRRNAGAVDIIETSLILLNASALLF